METKGQHREEKRCVLTAVYAFGVATALRAVGVTASSPTMLLYCVQERDRVVDSRSKTLLCPDLSRFSSCWIAMSVARKGAGQRAVARPRILFRS